MFRLELDSFVQKFKNLCQAGGNPNLIMKSEAGKVSVSLQVEFHSPSFQQVPSRSRRNGPSTQRRRERRAAERKAATEEAAADVAPEEAVLLLLAEIAAKASDDGSTSGNAMSEKDIAEPLESSNKANVTVVGNTENVSMATSLKDSGDFKCDECESEFNNSMALSDHDKLNHKVTKSPIPQIDGGNDVSKIDIEIAKLERPSDLKNYYPRNCEHCTKYLRNNSDFRKHIVNCMMARKK